MSAYFSIDSSLTGRKWVGPSADRDRHASHLAQATDLPFPLASILARLGVATEEVAGFIAPTLRDLLPNPDHLLDMGKAKARILSAIEAQERIAIFADYDVDGACSGALLFDWFSEFGIEPTLYVPDRIDEGYGPNVAAMQMLSKDHDLIICVDCGTLSYEPIEAASADILVLDHHLGGETLPKALAVVNPNRQDEDTELGYLCAAGVVFMVLVSCNKELREAGKTAPDLLALLDLVALATVADVAPLLGLNRAFVRQGLHIMAGRKRPGLVALFDAAKINSAPLSYHLGYQIGPRINAGGRIGKADLGIRLLTTRSPEEAAGLAARLNDLNLERREIEASVLQSALVQADERGLDAPLAWAAEDGWHAGVVGIVASRLKEKSNRPSIVIGFEGEIGKGSGRSIPGVDLGNAIATATREGLLLKGGGHKMAAGLTVSRENLEPAMARISHLLDRQGSAQMGPRDLHLDCALSPRAIDADLIEKFDLAGPFGASAPAPRFVLPFVRIAFCKPVGDTHLALSLEDETGAKIEAICFGAFESELGLTLKNHKGQIFHFAGRLEVDHWNGRRRPKFYVEDAAPIVENSGDESAD